MIDYPKIIIAMIELLCLVTKTLQTRQLLKAGGAEMIADALRGQADAISKGNAARQKVADAAVRDPAGVLRDDDGFKRK